MHTHTYTHTRNFALYMASRIPIFNDTPTQTYAKVQLHVNTILINYCHHAGLYPVVLHALALHSVTAIGFGSRYHAVSILHHEGIFLLVCVCFFFGTNIAVIYGDYDLY